MKNTSQHRSFSKWFLAVSVLLGFFTFSVSGGPSPVRVPVAQSTEWVYTAPKAVRHARFCVRVAENRSPFFTGVYNNHTVCHAQLCHVRFATQKAPPPHPVRLFLRVKTCTATPDGEPMPA